MSRVAVGLAGLGIGAALGYLIRPFITPCPPTECTEQWCRDQGFIKPEECPEPCPPFELIKTQEECDRCGGQWTQVGSTLEGQPIYECFPPSGIGTVTGVIPKKMPTAPTMKN